MLGQPALPLQPSTKVVEHDSVSYGRRLGVHASSMRSAAHWRLWCGQRNDEHFVEPVAWKAHGVATEAAHAVHVAHLLVQPRQVVPVRTQTVCDTTALGTTERRNAHQVWYRRVVRQCSL